MTTSETVLYEGGPMHNKYEAVEGGTVSIKVPVLAEFQPVDGPVQVQDVFYVRTRRVRDGKRVFRVVT